MLIVDIPLRLLPAPTARHPQPSADIPALPYGELDSLLHPPSRLALLTEPNEHRDQDPESGGCQYQTANGRPCPRPVIHYSDSDHPESYCAAHLAWLEQIEESLDLPYPDSPQALLDLLAYVTARVLTREMIPDRALLIMKLVRALDRQVRWI